MIIGSNEVNGTSFFVDAESKYVHGYTDSLQASYRCFELDQTFRIMVIPSDAGGLVQEAYYTIKAYHIERLSGGTRVLHTIDTIANKSGQIEFEWNPKTSVWGEYIVNSTYHTDIALICNVETEYGETYNIEIGYLGLFVPKNIVPYAEINILDKDTAITEKFSDFVQGKSKPSITVFPNGIYGSTITDYSVEFDGSTYLNQSEISPTTIVNTGAVPIVVHTKDSRGRTNVQTVTITVLPYVSPTITNFFAYRCTEDGTENSAGTIVFSEFAFEITPLNDLNDKIYTLMFREKDGEIWSEITSGNVYSFNGNVISESLFDIDKQYELVLTVTDFFGYTESKIIIPTSFSLLDLNASGKGFAIGKASEKDALEVAIPAEFTKKVIFSGGVEGAGGGAKDYPAPGVEEDTGVKWIDGKPIYRQVLQITGTNKDAESLSIPLGNFKLGFLIRMDGGIFTDADFCVLSTAHNTSFNGNLYTRIRYATTAPELRIVCGGGRSILSGYAILEYTKAD